MAETAVTAASRLLSERATLTTVSGCGKCGPSGWLEDENGNPVSRCPNCHPGVAPPPGAVRTKAPIPPLVRPRTDGSRGGQKGRTDSPVTPVRPSWETSDRTVAWNAVDLLSTDFPPPRWAVPGIIAEGVNVLAGPPKVGKSWLALGLAVAVASGGKALGSIDVDAGPVLYLALEDTGRRLQSRLGKVLAGSRPPRDLTCVIECPSLAHGGGHQIAMWLDKNPAARLVVIDVFAKLRGPVPPGASAYDADYRSVGQIKAIADGYGVPVVLVHHTRKATSDDYLADVSGTNGIAGAADATLVLRRTRGKADGVLQVTGRDVDESEYAMKFESDLGCWVMIDQPVAEVTLPDTRSAILAYLRTEPGQGPKRISDGTGLAYELVKKTVKRMADDNQLHTDGKGHYYPASDEVSPLSRAVPLPAHDHRARGQRPRSRVPARSSWHREDFGMNPAQTAYDDQFQAAAADARRMLEWRATSTNTRMGKVTSPWLQAKVREFRENLLARRVRYCPHISQTPMVAHTAAWATDRLVCTDCTPRLTPDEAEVTRCDQCGHVAPALYLGCAVNGPVLMAYGLCLECVRSAEKGR